MPSEFSRLMAEQIARARPKQAPSPRGHTVVGGRGALMGTQESAQVGVQVDLGPWMRLFGYKTPEEKKQMSDQLRSLRQSTSDEEWERMVSQESTQKVLESLEKTGYLGVIKEPSGRYNVPKVTPEAAVRGLTPEQIYARGGAPAERLEAAKERLRPKTEIDVLTMGGKQAATYIENQARLAEREAQAAETPAIKAVRQSQADMHRAAASASRIQGQLESFKLSMAPDEFQLAKERSQAEAKYYDAKAREADAHAKYWMGQADREMEKEQLQLLKSTQSIYKQSQLQIIKSLTDALQAIDRDKVLRELTAITSAYVYGVKVATRGMKGGATTGPANEAIAFWVDAVSPEVAKTPKTKGWGILGPKVVDPADDTRFQRYALEAAQLMQAMQVSTPEGVVTGLDDLLAARLLSIIQQCTLATTPTDKMQALAVWAIQEGTNRGYDMSGLIEYVRSIEAAKGPPTPAPPTGPIEDYGPVQ